MLKKRYPPSILKKQKSTCFLAFSLSNKISERMDKRYIDIGSPYLTTSVLSKYIILLTITETSNHGEYI